MKTPSAYSGKNLEIVTVSFWKRIYKLKYSEEVLATMYFPKKFSSYAIIEGFGNKWEVKRKSIWTRNLLIFKYGNHLPFSEYESNIWGSRGIINLSRGKKLHLKYGVLKRDCRIFASNNNMLIELKSAISLQGKAVINIREESGMLDENAWVIFLAWYIVLMNKRRTARGS